MVVTGLIKCGLLVAGAISLVLLTAISTTAEASFPSSRHKNGSPDRRRGAGPRCGTCALKDERTFALVPPSNFSVTLQAHPTFTWYVPETSGGETLNFQLVPSQRTQQKQEPLYEKTFQLDGSSGVMHLDLSEQENPPALDIDEVYVWSISIDCNPQEKSSSAIYFKSTVLRIEAEPEFIKQIQQVQTLLELSGLYASHGFWPDSLALLLQAKADTDELEASQKQDAAQGLDELFSSVGLVFFADQPLMKTYDQPGHIYQPVKNRPNIWISQSKEPPKLAVVKRWEGCGGGPARPVYADS